MEHGLDQRGRQVGGQVEDAESAIGGIETVVCKSPEMQWRMLVLEAADVLQQAA